MSRASSVQLHILGAIVALALLTSSPGPVEAQGVTTAAVAGRVIDAAGAPVVGARVQLRQVGTGALAEALTGEEGRFYLTNLRPGGPYTLSVSRIGYQTVTREGLTLRIGQRLDVEVELTETAVPLPEISVRVETDPDFDPSRMGVATLVDQATLDRLPTISRNFVEFAELSPLVKVDEEGVSIAGANLRFNNIQVDGALNQDVFGLSPSGVAGGQARARVIPLEAIEELQVLIAPYDVRQSGFTGGVLNAVTRSGTNRFEGSAFGFLRDETLVGDLVFDEVSRKPEQLENLYAGITLGGPIVRDRAHFFIAGELERRRRPPDGFQVGADDPIRTQLSPDSVARLEEILSGFGAAPGEAGSFTLENDLANLFARVDVQIDDRNSAMVRYNYAGADDDPQPNRLPGEAYELSSNGTRIDSRNHSFVGQWLANWSPSLSNDLLVNVQFLRDSEVPVGTYPRVEVDIQSEFQGDVLERRVRAGAEFFAHASELDQDIFQVTDAVTWAVGENRFTVGGGFERFSIRRLFLPGSLGSYRFASLADFAANRPSQYDVNVPLRPGDPSVAFDVNEWSAFFQQETKFGEALNVRLGFRIDVPVIPGQPTDNPEVTRQFGVETAALPSGNPLFSPRLGFNLQLGDEYTTQVRGGLGLFAGRPPFAWLANAFQNTGLESAFLTCTGDDAPAFDPATPVPSTCLDGRGADTGTPIINVFDPEFRFPQDFKASLAIDQQLPWGVVASLEGVYTKAMNQIFLEDLNIGAAVADDDRLHEAGYSDGFGFGTRESFGDPTTAGFTPRKRSDAFAQVIRITNRSDNFAYALSARLRKRFGDRVAIDAGYAFNRSGDTQSLFSLDATSNYGFNAIEGDPNTPQRQPSLFDRPHKVVVNATARFLERFGGTQVSLLYVGQSGVPYSYVYLGDLNADGFPGSGQALDLTNDLIFVTEGAFDFPTGGLSAFLFESLLTQEPCLQRNRLRVLSRNACRSPWSNQLDLRITQDIRAGRARVQIVFDMLNLLNFVNDEWGHVERGNPVIQVLRLDGRREDDPEPFSPAPEPDDPLQAVFVGPVRGGIDGGIVATRPTFPRVESSQWQAQFGIRVSF